MNDLSSNYRPTVIGVVLIGRNEGKRLIRCLDSVVSQADNVVYVDSGSADGSVEAARQRNVEVVELDMSKPFTAARARNAGFERLLAKCPNVQAVQFVDGDCEVVDGWIDRAADALGDDGDVVAVCGYRRERHPEHSWYNRICDVEWRSGSAGITDAFGGDVMIRASAFMDVGGYDASIIAGEDPELSVRLRKAGGQVLRLDETCTLHDANMTTFGQWWKRATRCGHAYAQIAELHGAPPERYFVVDVRKVWVWGFAIPLIAVATVVPTLGLSLPAVAGVYLLRVVRSAQFARTLKFGATDSWAWGWSCAFSKTPEFVGLMQYYLNRARRRQSQIIEYKGST